MRRFIFFVLILALFTTGCLSRTQGPVIDSQHGLVTVALSDADPIPWSPYNPPILAATVRPAPLLDGGYEECAEFLDQSAERMCAVDWKRTVITPEAKEQISLVLLNGAQVTRFRIVFAGHRPGEIAEGVAISREFVAPPYWSGELEFEVPIYPPFTRVLFVQLHWKIDDYWSGSSKDIFFAPCPDDYPWLEDEIGFCESVAK